MSMIIAPITNGIVIDHIEAGKGMQLYHFLGLGDLDCSVAVIKNAGSAKMGKKDIIKIDAVIDIDMDIIAYLDPGVTVNIISDGKSVKHTNLTPPESITDVIRCRNPRCITSVEPELRQVFRLTDRETRTYRCIYCESKAEVDKRK